MDRDDEHSAHTDRRYASPDAIPVIPDAENLRLLWNDLPFWEDKIAQLLKTVKTYS